MTKDMPLGPLRVRPWRLWVMLGAWALGIALIIGTYLQVSGETIRGFRADGPEAIGLRVKDAQIDLRQGRPEVARERLIALRDEDPLNPMIHALLGQAYAAQGDALPDAIASTRMALSLDPHFMNASYNLGCYYARQGDGERAMAALSRAVSLGFDDREAMASDGDLQALIPDPRLSHFLSGGSLPQALKFASMWTEPPRAVTGHPVDIFLEAWDLEAEGESAIELSYLGPGISTTWFPVARTLTHLESEEGAVGWRLRLRMTPMTPGRDLLGPLSLRVGGERVGVGLAGFVVEGPPLPPGSPELIKVNLRRFVSAPWAEVSEHPGEAPSLKRLKAEGAWVGAHQGLEVAPWPDRGPAALDLPKAQAAYHEWIVPRGGSAPEGFRTFALGDVPLEGARLE